jgi:UDP-N-acetylglucosamine 2-epimerase
VLFVSKYRQARHVLPALADAVAKTPGVQLAIKTHPAETPDAYAAVARGRANIRVLPAGAPLAPLLGASRAVVTVNSTVALDAGVLGVPALVIGLPNNLSPFVEAGIMAGAATEAEIAQALDRILYDERFRQQLERARVEYLTRFGIGSDGRAAARSAEAVVALISHGPQP